MKMKNLIIVGLFLSLVLAGVVSHYASPHPDGLMKAAEDVGFVQDENESKVSGSPLAGYGVAGVKDERISGGLAGVVGVLVVVALAGGGFMLLTRKNRQRS